MKTVILFLILCFNFSLFASDRNRGAGTQLGSGETKGDALAHAFARLPEGAVVKRVHFNGSSERVCVPGVGMVQTSGAWNCRIYYSR